jgi:RNA polymerase sigma-70 factor (ECF subfamily)
MPTATIRTAPEAVRVPAVREVFLEHAPFVLRLVRRLGVVPSDVEDVAQEVFVIVHRRFDTYDGSSSVRTWLFGITTRVVSDYRKRAHRRRELPTADPPNVSIEAPQHHDVSRKELREWLDRALDQLDEAKRVVFVLHDMEEVPMADIAEALGCPVNTAYSRLREARTKVRAFFDVRRFGRGER